MDCDWQLTRVIFEGTLLVSRLQLSFRGRVGDLKTRLSVLTTSIEKTKKFINRTVTYPEEVVKLGILNHYDLTL